MRAALIACVLSSIASALAYQVIRPNPTQGWTTEGAQPLEWQFVETDALNFTAVLVNEDTSLLPQPQVLAALIKRGDETASLNPPAGGWPVGGGFRVNLVKDEASLNTIYAQSNEFNISAPSTSASRSQTGTGSISRPTNTGTPNNNGGNNNAPSPSNSDAPAESNSPGNGALSTIVNTGLVTLVAGAVSLLL